MKLPLIDQFKARWKDCSGCRLSRTRTQVVFGEGNLNSPIMLVGEAPGEQEDREGKPFFSDAPAGSYLNKILAAPGVEIKRDDVYITNTCLCRPYEGAKNRAPLVDEIQACQARFFEEIEIVQPQILVLCGNTPLFMATGKKGISKLHGKLPFEFNTPNWTVFNVFATFHPAAFIYGSPAQIEFKKSLAYQDWQEIAQVYHKLA